VGETQTRTPPRRKYMCVCVCVCVSVYTRIGRSAHLPSVAGDNSSGNVIPTPACACTQEKYFQDEFPRSAAAAATASASVAVYGTLYYYTRSSPAQPLVAHYFRIYKHTRARTHTRLHTCCREILQNFNMIYPARVIYLSGFSYSVRAEIKLDSAGAVFRPRGRRGV